MPNRRFLISVTTLGGIKFSATELNRFRTSAQSHSDAKQRRARLSRAKQTQTKASAAMAAAPDVDQPRQRLTKQRAMVADDTTAL
mmetsp:Transcript_99702/g.197704  ORF Transcript_99702/g.197704 Transcript_99702/m.197704 type:complete len:85 (+) Transcript_99702:773-1027(+)